MLVPDTLYAKSGHVRIAYQVVGDGPFDLVFVPGFISNLDLAWEDPVRAQIWTRLAAFSRLILFEKRGTGLSDRIGGVPTLEERMDDVRAVMDAVGSRQAALFGNSEGGAMSMLFAATYPDRTRALVLYGAYGHFRSWVVSSDQLEAALERLEKNWGMGETLALFAPNLVSDDAYKRRHARFERLSASPSSAAALMRMNSEIDIRPILPSIRVPTLIVHREGDVRVHVEAGQFLAHQIPNAKYVELPGNDHLLWAGNTERVMDEVEEFLTGSGFARKANKFDGIYLGRLKGSDLLYAGKVDHGFDKTSTAELQARLKPLIRKTQPYAKKIAHRGVWVEPSLLAEIEYRAKSAEGKVRHPFFKGIREDL